MNLTLISSYTWQEWKGKSVVWHTKTEKYAKRLVDGHVTKYLNLQQQRKNQEKSNEIMINIITGLQELSRNGKDFILLNGWWQSSDDWVKKGNADKIVALFAYQQQLEQQLLQEEVDGNNARNSNEKEKGG